MFKYAVNCTQVGDVIYLLDKVDKQFFEGELNNKVGKCRYSHVEIIVPLPWFPKILEHFWFVLL